MKNDVGITQEEIDACEYILRTPYQSDTDFELNAKLSMFLVVYRDEKRSLFPSIKVDRLFMQCIMNRNYSELNSILPRQREIVETMFARANFDYEKID